MLKVKARDLLFLVRNDRRYQTIAVILFFLLIWPFVHNSNEQKTIIKTKKENQLISVGKTPEGEVTKDLIDVFRVGIDQLTGEVAIIRKDVDSQGAYIVENEKRVAEILKRIIERTYDDDSNNTTDNSVSPVSLNIMQKDAYELDNYKLDQFGFEDPVPLYEDSVSSEKVAIIGSGDRVRVRLLSGVIADTNGTAYPVVFQIESEIMGPNQTRLPVGDAVIIAAAQGSLRDSRVIFRLNQLNLSLPNGRRKVLPVDGWVIGEDGMQGMRGELIDPFGKALVAAVASGTIDGLGDGLATGQLTSSENYYSSTSNVSGDLLTYVIGRGLKGGATELSEYLRERSELQEPGVQVLSNRVSTAVFTESVTIPDLYQQIEKLYNEDLNSMD